MIANILIGGKSNKSPARRRAMWPAIRPRIRRATRHHHSGLEGNEGRQCDPRMLHQSLPQQNSNRDPNDHVSDTKRRPVVLRISELRKHHKARAQDADSINRAHLSCALSEAEQPGALRNASQESRWGDLERAGDPNNIDEAQVSLTTLDPPILY